MYALRQNRKLQWNYPEHVEHPTSEIRRWRGIEPRSANTAGYVIHRLASVALFRRFLSLSPKKAESWHRVFVTTKLREKFVARIPAAGVRSHAKGERK